MVRPMTHMPILSQAVQTLAACMPSRPAVLIFTMLPLAGCAHDALRDNTALVTNTLTDVHFQIVLANVARFHNDPDTVPSFAVASAGTVSSTDQGSAGVSPTYSPTLSSAQQGGGALPILSLLFPLSAQRSVTENWSLTPVTDADNLRRLRCAYRLLVQGESAPNAEFCHKQMQEFFLGEEANLADTFPPRGWYAIGSKENVPENVRYVASHGTTFVWVTAEGMNGLAVFAMGAMDMATGKLHTPQRTVLRKYKGDAKPENIVETQVTTTEDDPDALEAIRQGRTRRPIRSRVTDSALLNPGLFFVPGP